MKINRNDAGMAKAPARAMLIMLLVLAMSLSALSAAGIPKADAVQAESALGIQSVSGLTTQSTGGRTVNAAIAWAQSKAGSTVGGGECVDFIKAYYSYLGVSPVTGNGADYSWNSLPSGWSRVKGGKPQKGDILVYTGGWGHVAIYASDKSTYHQNYSGSRYVRHVTDVAYNGFTNPYWGYIRPNWSGAPTGYLDLGTNFRAAMLFKGAPAILVDKGNVELAKEANRAYEHWLFTRQSDGSYIIKSVYSGKALDVSGGNSANGTNVQTYPEWSSNNPWQRWYIYSNGDGYRIVPKGATDKCLACWGDSSAAGTNVTLWSWKDTAGQRLSIYKYASSNAVPTGVALPAKLSVGVGKSRNVSATITPSNTESNKLAVTWQSGDASIATIDSSGKLTGVKAGETTITATNVYNDKLSATATVVVSEVDEEAPVISDARITAICSEGENTRVSVSARVTDNVGVASSYTRTTDDGRSIKSISGSVHHFIEIGETGSGKKMEVYMGPPFWSKVENTTGLTDQPQKNINWTFDLVAPQYCGERNWIELRVCDEAGNWAESKVLEFDTPSLGDVVHMQVGDELPAQDAFGAAVDSGWWRVDGEQSLIEVNGKGDSADPYRLKAVKAGVAKIVYQNVQNGQCAIKTFVIKEPGASEDLSSVDFNQRVVDELFAAIDALPDPEAVTLNDEDAIERCRARLEGLTDAQLELVSVSEWNSLLGKLEACEEVLSNLVSVQNAEQARSALADQASDADEKAVAAVKAAIGELPDSKAITLNHSDQVENAIALLYGLTDTQLGLVSVAEWCTLTTKVDAARETIAKLRDITTRSAKLEYSSATYQNGKALKPGVTIAGLVKDRDFTVDYSNNRNVGNQACVKITGTGKYTGSKCLYFTIKQADIMAAFPKLGLSAKSFAYTGKAIKPGVSSTLKGFKSSYVKLTYAKNVNIGKATVKVEGVGNYKGGATFSFSIKPAKAKVAIVKPEKKGLTVKAKAQKGGVKYQVQYRLGKGAWKTKETSKTTLTIKKLKSGKSYSVRVRALKKVGGVSYCGPWSAVTAARPK